MIHELRVYRAVPGRMPDVLRRFSDHTLAYFEQYGIRQVGFWTTTIGDSHNDMYYLLEWESLAERERKWNAFSADPGWQKVRAASEENGPIVASAANTILAPTAFSALK